MFNKGDKIVYGQTGVCIVEDIAQRELIKHVKRLYYKLRPIYQQNNIIYAPAESDKVLIRPVISKDEADALIKKMPEFAVFRRLRRVAVYFGHFFNKRVRFVL